MLEAMLFEAFFWRPERARPALTDVRDDAEFVKWTLYRALGFERIDTADGAWTIRLRLIDPVSAAEAGEGSIP